ncbi:hypothetical protein GCM10023340_32060 [Nocardioides marinquilinus]|uniref:Uncharacterized protein n=2 Tax=Nocardioides marinquilinus TaxID=1210400 RepID=A0ABP9PX46_9ACTN
MQQFHRDGVRLSDTDTARLLVTVESITIRDQLWLDMNRSNASSHVALWTDLTKRAPDDVRAAPASLLGFASWLSGHGALAWCRVGRPGATQERRRDVLRGGSNRALGHRLQAW